jgi:hypothetical protein
VVDVEILPAEFSTLARRESIRTLSTVGHLLSHLHHQLAVLGIGFAQRSAQFV